MLNFHTEIRELELGQRVWIGANSKETSKYVIASVFDKKIKDFKNKERSKNSQETILCMVLRFSCSDHSPPFFSRFVSLCFWCWVDAIAYIFFLVIFFLAALVYPFNCVDVLFFFVLLSSVSVLDGYDGDGHCDKGSLRVRKVKFFWTLFKRPLTPPPFYLNICPILQGVFFKRVFEHLI